MLTNPISRKISFWFYRRSLIPPCLSPLSAPVGDKRLPLATIAAAARKWNFSRFHNAFGKILLHCRNGRGGGFMGLGQSVQSNILLKITFSTVWNFSFMKNYIFSMYTNDRIFIFFSEIFMELSSEKAQNKLFCCSSRKSVIVYLPL